MKAFTIATLLSLSVLVAAVPPFDPAGAKNVGNQNGQQFIGGQCINDKDCQSGCCANPTGICSGLGAAFQNGKEGCGFPSASTSASASVAIVPVDTTSSAAITESTSVASTTPANGGPPFDPNGAHLVGNNAGQQFITGQCLSDADCASACCAGPSGICSGPGASTQNGKTGCGFVAAGSSASAAVASPVATSSVAAAAVATAATNGGPAFDPAGAKNVGKGDGSQFIGGQCLSGADCQSTCCAGPSGICSGLGAQTQAGKTGCGFVSKKKLLRV